MFDGKRGGKKKQLKSCGRMFCYHRIELRCYLILIKRLQFEATTESINRPIRFHLFRLPSTNNEHARKNLSNQNWMCELTRELGREKTQWG